MCQISTFPRLGDHVDDIKSTRLLRFRLKLRENVRTIRNESKRENQVGEFLKSNSYTDAEPTEFEWIFFQDLCHWRGRIVFM